MIRAVSDGVTGLAQVLGIRGPSGPQGSPLPRIFRVHLTKEETQRNTLFRRSASKCDDDLTSIKARIQQLKSTTNSYRVANPKDIPDCTNAPTFKPHLDSKIQPEAPPNTPPPLPFPTVFDAPPVPDEGDTPRIERKSLKSQWKGNDRYIEKRRDDVRKDFSLNWQSVPAGGVSEEKAEIMLAQGLFSSLSDPPLSTVKALHDNLLKNMNQSVDGAVKNERDTKDIKDARNGKTFTSRRSSFSSLHNDLSNLLTTLNKFGMESLRCSCPFYGCPVFTVRLYLASKILKGNLRRDAKSRSLAMKVLGRVALLSQILPRCSRIHSLDELGLLHRKPLRALVDHVVSDTAESRGMVHTLANLVAGRTPAIEPTPPIDFYVSEIVVPCVLPALFRAVRKTNDLDFQASQVPNLYALMVNKASRVRPLPTFHCTKGWREGVFDLLLYAWQKWKSPSFNPTPSSRSRHMRYASIASSISQSLSISSSKTQKSHPNTAPTENNTSTSPLQQALLSSKNIITRSRGPSSSASSNSHISIASENTTPRGARISNTLSSDNVIPEEDPKTNRDTGEEHPSTETQTPAEGKPLENINGTIRIIRPSPQNNLRASPRSPSTDLDRHRSSSGDRKSSPESSPSVPVVPSQRRCSSRGDSSSRDLEPKEIVLQYALQIEAAYCLWAQTTRNKIEFATVIGKFFAIVPAMLGEDTAAVSRLFFHENLKRIKGQVVARLRVDVGKEGWSKLAVWLSYFLQCLLFGGGKGWVGLTLKGDVNLPRLTGSLRADCQNLKLCTRILGGLGLNIRFEEATYTESEKLNEGLLKGMHYVGVLVKKLNHLYSRALSKPSARKELSKEAVELVKSRDSSRALSFLRYTSGHLFSSLGTCLLEQKLLKFGSSRGIWCRLTPKKLLIANKRSNLRPGEAELEIRVQDIKSVTLLGGEVEEGLGTFEEEFAEGAGFRITTTKNKEVSLQASEQGRWRDWVHMLSLTTSTYRALSTAGDAWLGLFTDVSEPGSDPAFFPMRNVRMTQLNALSKSSNTKSMNMSVKTTTPTPVTPKLEPEDSNTKKISYESQSMPRISRLSRLFDGRREVKDGEDGVKRACWGCSKQFGLLNKGVRCLGCGSHFCKGCIREPILKQKSIWLRSSKSVRCRRCYWRKRRAEGQRLAGELCMLGEQNSDSMHRLKVLGDPAAYALVRESRAMRMSMPGEDLLFSGEGEIADAEGKKRLIVLTSHAIYLFKPKSSRPCRMRLSLAHLSAASVVDSKLLSVPVLQLVTSAGKKIELVCACPEQLAHNLRVGIKTAAVTEASIVQGSEDVAPPLGSGRKVPGSPHIIRRRSMSSVLHFG